MLAWTLCTKQDVKNLHNISVDSLDDSWSEMVEGLIAEHMGSPAMSQDITYIETSDGDGRYVIKVRRPPIKSVTSVSFSGSTIPASDYEVEDTTVTLLYYTLPVGIKNIEIEYVSGYEVGEIPNSVRLAAAAMVAAIANHYKRFGADTSLKWADVENPSLAGGTPTRTVGLATHLKDIMRSVLRRNKLRIG